MSNSDDHDMEVDAVPGKRIPWVEKYRPEKVEDVSHQHEVVQTLKSAIDNGGSIPHLMFYGPPGTGILVFPLSYFFHLVPCNNPKHCIR